MIKRVADKKERTEIRERAENIKKNLNEIRKRRLYRFIFSIKRSIEALFCHFSLL